MLKHASAQIKYKHLRH